MAGFTPERRRAERDADWKGTDRRSGKDANRDPLTGATVGGLGGRGIAEMIDPTAEEAYWRESYASEPYYEKGYTYEDYHPAYRTGWEGRGRYEGRSFDEVERELQADYNRNRGSAGLDWEKSRPAARAAWDRFDVDDLERS